MTSCYHGSNISESQQSFLTEMAVCLAKRYMGFRFVPGRSHAQESHTCQFVLFFSYHIYRTSDLLRSRFFLPWQRDIRTTPLSI